MKNIIKTLLTSISIFAFIGCGEVRQPQIKQVNSGTKLTNSWIIYNKIAKENNLPILDFVATSLNKPKKRGIVSNYAFFKNIDKQLYLYTKWHNVKRDDILEYKLYQPDGRMYDYKHYKYKYSSNKWNASKRLFIKDFFISKNVGTWRFDIFMNDTYVTSKLFNINKKSKNSTKTNTTKTIAVLPYYDSELNRWTHSKAMRDYLPQGILHYNKNVKVIHPNYILRNLASPNTNYENFDAYINNDLIEQKSIIYDSLINDNVDYVILGKIQSIANDSLDTEAISYVIDLKNKKLISKIKIDDSITRGDIDSYKQHRIRIYQKILDSVQPVISKLL